jgi:hypothetical protein
VVAEEGVAVGGPPVVADAGKGKEEEVRPEAKVEDAYTAWVRCLSPFNFLSFSA